MNKLALLSISLVVIIATTSSVSATQVVADASSSSGCHNATGSCTKKHFVCANEEAIPHSKRCDGVEDCADGTDEYMCDQSPKPFHQRSFAERSAITEVACIKCTCLKGSITVGSGATGSWWQIATLAPRDHTMLTDAPAYENKPCNPSGTTEIVLNVYKKQNKGCRGWVCCFRQQSCKTCTAGTPATHCYP